MTDYPNLMGAPIHWAPDSTNLADVRQGIVTHQYSATRVRVQLYSWLGGHATNRETLDLATVVHHIYATEEEWRAVGQSIMARTRARFAAAA